ncbi:MAG: alpha-amylase family protein [Bacteroidetes bacterium]|nr:alpha-amylase family protein [Bacteroidota bacterium]MDA1333290.1 alpha-amylase family protein [Bacteroidota bacterium]
MRSSISLLFLALGLSACQSESTGVAGYSASMTEAPTHGVVVHLFEWRWDDVAQECEEFLGPNGFSAVQISPPAENHVIGGRPWYERYQPVSYQLESRSGTREQFADMVSRCHAAGVEIIADVLFNHMADGDLEHESLQFSGVGTNGTEFGPYDYPGLYTDADFHHCSLTADGTIQDWDDTRQLRECELVGLSDLATETDHVRSTLASYVSDLVSLGVDGLRLDAAKHVYPEDIAAILEQADFQGYVVQEVATGGRYMDWMREYETNGDITEFSYTEALGELLRQRSWSDLAPEGWLWSSREYIPSQRAMVFVDNHDRQRGHGGASAIFHGDGDLYALAQVYTLTWGYGRPRVMSSYNFETDFQGPPMNADEAIIPVYSAEGLNCGDGEWVCEHRWPPIAGAVAFRNNVSPDAPVTSWWTDGSNQIAFGRGSEGFVVINGSGSDMDAILPTQLPEGTYCNRLVDGPCEPVQVDADGKLSVRLDPMSALAVDLGSQPE